MEKDIVLKVIEAMKEMNSITSKLVAELEKELVGLEKEEKPKKEGKKAKASGADAPEEKKPGVITVADITLEMLREMATKYSSAFGMQKLLELNVKHTTAKKLKDVDPKMYGVLYGAMSDELAKAPNPAAAPAGGASAVAPEAPKEITKDKLREHAAQFIAANGETAFSAVLKAFGAHKLSEVAIEKYAALLEAISNA